MAPAGTSSPSPATDAVQRVPVAAVQEAIARQRELTSETHAGRQRRLWTWLAVALGALCVALVAIVAIALATVEPPAAQSAAPATTAVENPALAAEPEAGAARAVLSALASRESPPSPRLELIPDLGDRGLNQGWTWAVSGSGETVRRLQASTPLRSERGDSGYRLAIAGDSDGSWRVTLQRRQRDLPWPAPGSTLTLRLGEGPERAIAIGESDRDALLLGEAALVGDLLAVDGIALSFVAGDSEFRLRASTLALRSLIRSEPKQ
ncbi:MAG: hypothetical protein N3B15_03770 [Planctomycetota bacterium]|nr:hypothetical protein [Planctomycetota bacterium]MCX8039675.1 hypothetical protein [Planctomycetota bacterium]